MNFQTSVIRVHRGEVRVAEKFSLETINEHLHSILKVAERPSWRFRIRKG